MSLPIEFFTGRAFRTLEKTDEVQRWERIAGPVGIFLWKERNNPPYGCSVMLRELGSTKHGINLWLAYGSDPHKLVSRALDFTQEAQKGLWDLVMEGPFLEKKDPNCVGWEF